MIIPHLKYSNETSIKEHNILEQIKHTQLTYQRLCSDTRATSLNLLPSSQMLQITLSPALISCNFSLRSKLMKAEEGICQNVMENKEEDQVSDAEYANDSFAKLQTIHFKKFSLKEN